MPEVPARPGVPVIHFAKAHQLNNTIYYVHIGTILAFTIFFLVDGIILAARKNSACILSFLISVLIFTGLFIPAITDDYSIADTVLEIMILIVGFLIVVLFFGAFIIIIVMLIATVVRFIIGE